ncbi:uncharacterized protein LOC113017613 isoform X2 [Astatotilapia calliptera]|uniref:uncharacterized protein LOC113017613 isoform X2 n=1 Tax=Astatotilapia calliptera TaxID=8154 RepID=UPI000E3FD8A3|nr:uncharacterized protein LOC113017613 isoform X2 [Astatotilapia calliptera]
MLAHVYQNGQNQPQHQDQGYAGHTEMNGDPLGTGDFSLTLKDFSLTESIYCCTIYSEDREILLQKLVTLKVKDNLPQDITVEWRRSDSKNMLVHVYQNGQNQLDHQDQIYRGHTEMNEDPVKNRDLSLTLNDLCFNYHGLYFCTVYKEEEILLQKTVALWVKVIQAEVVEEQEDLQSAVLPFETTAHLPKDVTVEWKLTDPKHMMVHVYQNAKNQPNKQDKVYRGRTDMKEDLLRTGDLSLTLKNLSLHDSGVYTCTVYKSGKTLQQKVVTLCVKGSWKSIMSEVLSRKN